MFPLKSQNPNAYLIGILCVYYIVMPNFQIKLFRLCVRVVRLVVFRLIFSIHNHHCNILHSA